MAGIYLHIPFCKQACHYCDFHFSTSLKNKKALIEALRLELILRKHEFENERIETIYFGGGTPSLLTSDELEILIKTIQENYQLSAHPEITLEANPDDLSANTISKLAKSPINRLSIGVQSFFDDDLQFMNRGHSAVEAKNALKVANKHFNNNTIDLIYGVPNMTKSKWKKNLQIAFDLGVNHISSYALTVEPKTALAHFIRDGKYPPVSDELALEHFKILMDETEKNGFIQYEISNFGKPNYFSKHNTAYWQGKPYLGFGPSAHSFNKDQRSWNVANNTKYIKAIQNNGEYREKETLTEVDIFNEYIMTGLRTIWGVSIAKIATNFGPEYSRHLSRTSEKYIKEELLFISKEIKEFPSLKATNKGKFLIDGIASNLFMI